MSESSHFEGHETPPQPKVDFESILERGEIAGTKALEGWECYDVVDIKDDGKALFRTESDKYEEDIMIRGRGLFRNDLEILAAKIDKTLGFNLVPAVARRSLGGKSGTLQQFMENAVIAAKLGFQDWFEMVDESEIIKAAVFDYLIDAKDRGTTNFLVDKNSRKIWLIDHDYYMLVDWKFGSVILRKAINKGLTELPEEIKKAIENLLEKIDSILDLDVKPEIKAVLRGIKVRAEDLIETGTLA